MTTNRRRQAAAKIREVASAAIYTSKEMQWCPDYLFRAMRHVQRNCDVCCSKHEPFDGPDTRHECVQPTRESGTYVALMSPIVGLAIADLLEQTVTSSSTAAYCNRIADLILDDSEEA